MNAGWQQDHGSHDAMLTTRTPMHLGRPSKVQRYSSSMHGAMEEDSMMTRYDDDINTTKQITIANIYIPPRDSTSTHYKTADTDIQHCIQHITNIPHSVLTGDVNAHSTLWHSYTDDHRGQLIADVINNSDHIILNTNTPTRVPNTTLQQTYSPDITMSDCIVC